MKKPFLVFCSGALFALSSFVANAQTQWISPSTTMGTNQQFMIGGTSGLSSGLAVRKLVLQGDSPWLVLKDTIGVYSPSGAMTNPLGIKLKTVRSGSFDIFAYSNSATPVFAIKPNSVDFGFYLKNNNNITLGSENSGLSSGIIGLNSSLVTIGNTTVYAGSALTVQGSGTFKGSIQSITTTDNTPGLSLGNSNNYYIRFFAKCIDGAFNAITKLNDAAIIYGGANPSTSGFVIAPSATGPSGLRMDKDGKVILGSVTSTPAGYNLYVKNGILTEKVTVATDGSSFWADFVFNKDYDLKPLSEVESYITKNHHLSEIPTTDEVNKNGVNLLEMDAKLLQKIEELTLYTIQMNKEIIQVRKDNEALKAKVEQLSK